MSLSATSAAYPLPPDGSVFNAQPYADGDFGRRPLPRLAAERMRTICADASAEFIQLRYELEADIRKANTRTAATRAKRRLALNPHLWQPPTTSEMSRVVLKFGRQASLVD